MKPRTHDKTSLLTAADEALLVHLTVDGIDVEEATSLFDDLPHLRELIADAEMAQNKEASE